MNNDFSRINEIFLPLIEKYSLIYQSKEELKKYQKQEKYFPSWDLAWEEYQKKLKRKKLMLRVIKKKKLKNFLIYIKARLFLLVFIRLLILPKRNFKL